MTRKLKYQNEKTTGNCKLKVPQCGADRPIRKPLPWASENLAFTTERTPDPPACRPTPTRLETGPGDAQPSATRQTEVLVPGHR